MNKEEYSLTNQYSIAVLLTSYGGVEDYKNFVQYNRQASQYIAAKFAPIPQWLYPLAARILSIRDLYKWGYKHDHFISPQNKIFENQRRGIEKHLQEKWGENVQVFTGFSFFEPFVKKVLTQIKDKGFNKILIYPLLVVDSIFTSSIAVEQINQALAQLGSEDWLQDLRYIPSFHDHFDYINLIVHQLEEKMALHHGGMIYN
jgi:ferrochelatase